jgi:hypothetical protein
MKFNYLIIVLFCGLLAVSCNNDSNQKQVKTDSTNLSQNVGLNNSSVNNNQSIASEVNNRLNTDYNTAVISLNLPGSPVDPKKLKDFIPDKIPGAIRAPISTGSIMGDNDKLFTTASCNYTFTKGGLVINIQDYGRYENLTSQDKKYFSKMPTESGYETETVVTNEGKGFILWDAEARNGRMFYLLANRFVIKLEAYTLPSKAGDIIFYFNMINQKAILQTATEK